MPERERTMMYVMVDLDPFPGAFHTPESARDAVQAILLDRIGHYTPVVILEQD